MLLFLLAPLSVGFIEPLVTISPSTTQPKPKPNQNTMHVDDGWTFNPPDDWTFHQDDANPDNPVFSFPIKCGEKYSISGDVTIFSGTGKIRIRLTDRGILQNQELQVMKIMILDL